jgi:hypothetical protein
MYFSHTAPALAVACDLRQQSSISLFRELNGEKLKDEEVKSLAGKGSLAKLF